MNHTDDEVPVDTPGGGPDFYSSMLELRVEAFSHKLPRRPLTGFGSGASWMRQEFFMTKPLVAALCCVATLSLVATNGTQAADQGAAEERVFNLVVGKDITQEDALEIEIEPTHVPGIRPGSLNLSLTLGYFNMEKTLLKYDRIIYLATSEHFYYGDIELKNNPGFNPILRLSYTLTPWLAFEAQSGVTFADYQSTINSAYRIDPRQGIQVPEPTNPGPFDPEMRSTFIWNNNFNVLWYPLNMGGEGKGRFHPYLTGGLGHALYEIDSEYTDTTSGGMNANAGLGVILIADRRINIRAEMVYHRHEIQFKPSESFDERDQGTVQVPVYEFNEVGQYGRVPEFTKQTMSGLTMQIGFSASF